MSADELAYKAWIGDLPAVKRCVEAGGDVNATNNNNWTPLCLAVENSHEAVYRYLLEQGARISKRSSRTDPRTALHVAAHRGNDTAVRLLIHWGAMVNAQTDKQRFTPLHSAIAAAQADIVPILLENGARLDLCNARGETPVAQCQQLLDQCADRTSDTAQRLSTIVNLLRKKRPAPTAVSADAVLQAAAAGQLDTLRALLGTGAPADASAGTGWPASALALERGHLDCTALLFAQHVPVAWRSSKGLSLLHIAAFRGLPRGVRLCVEHGLSPDTGGGEGGRVHPLHSAVAGCVEAAGDEGRRRGCVECAVQLVRLGAQDAAVRSALEKAEAARLLDVAQLLRHELARRTRVPLGSAAGTATAGGPSDSASAYTQRRPGPSPVPPPLQPLSPAELLALPHSVQHDLDAPLMPVRLADGRYGFAVGCVVPPDDYRTRLPLRVVALSPCLDLSALSQWDTLVPLLLRVQKAVAQSRCLLLAAPPDKLQPLLPAGVPRPPPWLGLSGARSDWINARMNELFVMRVKNLAADARPITFGQVFRTLHAAGISAFVVGGAVRDLVQGNADGIADIDLAVDASAQQLLDLAAAQGWRRPLCSKFGMLSFGDRDAIPNLEAKCIGGLNSDRVRSAGGLSSSGAALFLEPLNRDFACNALYYCPLNGVVLDSCGGAGLDDAVARRLTVPVPPELWEQWLSGNPSKLLRFWKMTARGYTASPDLCAFFAQAARSLMGSPELTASDCRIYAQRAFAKHPEAYQGFREAVAQHMGREFAARWFPPDAMSG